MMAAPHRSKISWTDYSGGDANFVTGCTPVSPGCANCYARAIYERFGHDFSLVEWHTDKLLRLAAWRPANFVSKRDNPQQADRVWPPTVFVCDTGDLFHEDVPVAFMVQAFELMTERADVDWLVLTKRAGRMQVFVTSWHGGYHHEAEKRPPGCRPLAPNIWLGVTAENQETANERIPLLLEVPAAVRFVSVEPMLMPTNLRPYLPGLDWVICGAESGPNRRPFDVAWALDLYERCREAGVPFFYKQGSALKPGQDAELPGFGVVQEWPDA